MQLGPVLTASFCVLLIVAIVCQDLSEAQRAVGGQAFFLR